MSKNAESRDRILIVNLTYKFRYHSYIICGGYINNIEQVVNLIKRKLYACSRVINFKESIKHKDIWSYYVWLKAY